MYSKAANKSTIDDFLGIVAAAKNGHVFSSVIHLNIRLPYNSFDFKHIARCNFPVLKQLQLYCVCLDSLPTNPNVSCLKLVGCTFVEKKKKKAKQFLCQFVGFRNRERKSTHKRMPTAKAFKLKIRAHCESFLS